jgi:hypothetical protein
MRWTEEMTHMCPVKCTRLKVRRRSLHHDIRMKAKKPLFSVAKKSGVKQKDGDQNCSRNVLAIGRGSPIGYFLAIKKEGAVSKRKSWKTDIY